MNCVLKQYFIGSIHYLYTAIIYAPCIIIIEHIMLWLLHTCNYIPTEPFILEGLLYGDIGISDELERIYEKRDVQSCNSHRACSDTVELSGGSQPYTIPS